MEVAVGVGYLGKVRLCFSGKSQFLYDKLSATSERRFSAVPKLEARRRKMSHSHFEAGTAQSANERPGSDDRLLTKLRLSFSPVPW